MRTDALPRVDRRFDRRLYGHIYVSHEELRERGMPIDMKVWDRLLYNGELFSIRVPTTNGYLILRHDQRNAL